MTWRDLIVAPNQTHHLRHGEPAYERRFDEVLKFHSPGLAPVRASKEAWHIRPDGSDAYSNRFRRAFGFYEDLAAVDSGSGWFHINAVGSQAYEVSFAWCGNFQEGRCAVRCLSGKYGHINRDGVFTTDPEWNYAGDFRDGVAVIQNNSGKCTHVTQDGSLLHNAWFEDLDVFHKGFARARDEHGWMHINTDGQALYARRFALVEPFYNGQARIERFDGAREVVNERGKCIVELCPPRRSEFAVLSEDLVGYWKTEAIATAVELGVVDALPARSEDIAGKLGLRQDRLHRLLMGLGELGMVVVSGEQWALTAKGSYLRRDHPSSLSEAAAEYSTLLREPWQCLRTAMQSHSEWQPPDIFHSVANDEERLAPHHRMLSSYADHDYAQVPPLLGLEGNERVIDAGGGTGALARQLLKVHPSLHCTLLDLPNVIEAAKRQPGPGSGLHYCSCDLFEAWPITADAVVLARVLHDWDDENAVQILRNARRSLETKGRLFVIEMIRPDEGFGGSLCDLHLLAVTGGQERTREEFADLLDRSGFSLKEVRSTSSVVSVLVGTAK
ncbi:methyltransferase domain-containing protein [bacterium]|nr:methyltransferase domain-containing protein [bacterium]